MIGTPPGCRPSACGNASLPRTTDRHRGRSGASEPMYSALAYASFGARDLPGRLARAGRSREGDVPCRRVEDVGGGSAPPRPCPLRSWCWRRCRVPRSRERPRWPAAAVAEGTRSASTTYDARAGVPARMRQAVRAARLLAQAPPALRQLDASLGVQGVVQLDPITGTPRIIAKLNGFLSAPRAGSARVVAMDYLRAHEAAFGITDATLGTLVFVRDYVSIDGTHHLAWTQRRAGIDVFGSGLRINVTKDGRVISVLGSPVAGLADVAHGGDRARRARDLDGGRGREAHERHGPARGDARRHDPPDEPHRDEGLLPPLRRHAARLADVPLGSPGVVPQRRGRADRRDPVPPVPHRRRQRERLRELPARAEGRRAAHGEPQPVPLRAEPPVRRQRVGHHRRERRQRRPEVGGGPPAQGPATGRSRSCRSRTRRTHRAS